MVSIAAAVCLVLSTGCIANSIRLKQTVRIMTIARSTRAGLFCFAPRKFNQSSVDDVGPVGDDQAIRVLREMNSLVDDHEEFVKNLAPRLDAK